MRSQVLVLSVVVALAGASASPVFGQASQPAKVPKAKTKASGKIVYSTFRKRAVTLRVYDLATKTTKTLLDDGSLANGISPKGATLVTWNKGQNELTFRSLAKPTVVLGSLPKTFGWPSFLDEDTVVLPDYQPKGDPAVKFQLNQVKIKSGKRKSLATFGATSWDDVVPALSPDRKKLVFFLRGAEPGLHIYHLADGRTGRISPAGVRFRWVSNTHCMVFERKGSQTWWCKLDKAEMGLIKLESLGLGSLPGAKVGGHLVYAKPSAVRGFLELVARDLKTKKETSVSTELPAGELSMYGFVTPLPSGAFVFAEGMPSGARAMRLVHADLGTGKLVKTVLVTEKDALIGLPMFAP